MLWIGLEKMLFVVEERGKENVVPVRLLSSEKLGFLNADCVIGNRQGNAGQQKQRRKGKRDREMYLTVLCTQKSDSYD